MPYYQSWWCSMHSITTQSSSMGGPSMSNAPLGMSEFMFYLRICKGPHGLYF